MAKEQPLTKNDIKEVFAEGFQEEFPKAFKKEFKGAFSEALKTEFPKAFHEAFEPYARSIAGEFGVAKQERKIMRKEVATINLKLSDIVYRDEFLNLVKRVENLEVKTK